MSSIWCGAERFAHMDITRPDTGLQRLYGRERMPEHKAFERCFRKFDIPATHAVFRGLYRRFFKRLKFDSFTLDTDSPVKKKICPDNLPYSAVIYFSINLPTATTLSEEAAVRDFISESVLCTVVSDSPSFFNRFNMGLTVMKISFNSFIISL